MMDSRRESTNATSLSQKNSQLNSKYIPLYLQMNVIPIHPEQDSFYRSRGIITEIHYWSKFRKQLKWGSNKVTFTIQSLELRLRKYHERGSINIVIRYRRPGVCSKMFTIYDREVALNEMSAMGWPKQDPKKDNTN